MNAENKPKRLGEILMDEGVITEDQLNIALTEQKKVHEPLGKLLVNLGFATEVHHALCTGRSAVAGKCRFVARGPRSGRDQNGQLRFRAQA